MLQNQMQVILKDILLTNSETGWKLWFLKILMTKAYI